MKITDALLGEHAVIYPGLDRIAEASFATAEEMRAAAAILAAGLASHARIEDESCSCRSRSRSAARWARSR